MSLPQPHRAPSRSGVQARCTSTSHSIPKPTQSPSFERGRADPGTDRRKASRGDCSKAAPLLQQILLDRSGRATPEVASALEGSARPLDFRVETTARARAEANLRYCLSSCATRFPPSRMMLGSIHVYGKGYRKKLFSLRLLIPNLSHSLRSTKKSLTLSSRARTLIPFQTSRRGSISRGDGMICTVWRAGKRELRIGRTLCGGSEKAGGGKGSARPFAPAATPNKGQEWEDVGARLTDSG